MTLHDVTSLSGELVPTILMAIGIVLPDADGVVVRRFVMACRLARCGYRRVHVSCYGRDLVTIECERCGLPLVILYELRPLLNRGAFQENAIPEFPAA
jgi:hypothetical protein